MKLYVLKNRFKYDDFTEIVGIFDSATRLNDAKITFMKSFPEVPEEHFNFYDEEYELNAIK